MGSCPSSALSLTSAGQMCTVKFCVRLVPGEQGLLGRIQDRARRSPETCPRRWRAQSLELSVFTPAGLWGSHDTTLFRSCLLYMPPSLGTLVGVLTLAPGSHVTGPTPVLSESPYALLSPTSQICPRAFADDSTTPSLPSLARPPASTFPALLSSALGPGAQDCGCYTCSLSPCRTISSTLFSAHPRGCQQCPSQSR